MLLFINIIIYKFVSFVLPTSDYMFFLDVSPEESLKRIDNRSEETEMFENMEELEKARIKSKKVTYDWNIINADNSIAKVNDEIKEEVNDEIRPLYETVRKNIKHLKPGGRLCIITFHSLEDRAVKNAFTEAEGICKCPKDLPYCVCGAKSFGKIITKKPILPTEEEQRENSRAKSAKLRIFEKKI